MRRYRYSWFTRPRDSKASRLKSSTNTYRTRDEPATKLTVTANIQPSEPNKTVGGVQNVPCIQKIVLTIGHQKPMFTFDAKSSLVRVFPVHCGSQRYTLATFEPLILYLYNQSLRAAHPCKRRLYGTMRQHSYWHEWPTMTPIQWPNACSAHRIAQLNKIQTKLRLYLPLEPLDYVTIDILDPWQTT